MTDLNDFDATEPIPTEPRNADEVAAHRGSAPLLPPSGQQPPEWWGEFFRLLMRGATVIGAAESVGQEPHDLLALRRNNPEFAAGWNTTEELMCLAVETGVYQQALKGKVPAQICWLLNRAPDRWKNAGGPASDVSGIDNMSDDELLTMARQYGVDVPPEFHGDGLP